MSYYEVSKSGCVVAFDDLEKAIEYADKYNCTVISQFGGCFSEYEKCWFCDEWHDTNEINKNGVCSRCEFYLKTKE